MTVQMLALRALWGAWRAQIIGRKFVQDVGILTMANFAGAALNFIQGIFVARWLGPELYGIAALVMSYPDLIYTFFDARSGEATVRYVSQFHSRNEPARAVAMCQCGYGLDLAIAALAFFVVWFTAPWAARHIVHKPEVSWLIFLYATAFIPRAMSGTSRAVLATLGRFPLSAGVAVVTTGVRAVLILGLVLAGWGVTGVIWGNAVTLAFQGIVLGVVGHVAIRRTWGTAWFAGSWQALRGQRREIARFILYTDLNALLGLFVKQVDTVVLGYFRGPAEVGYYHLAKAIRTMVGNLESPLETVSYPHLARVWGVAQHDELKQVIKRYAMGIGIPLAVCVLGILPLLPAVISLLVGGQYLPAISISQVLLIGGAIHLGLFWVRPLYLSTGKVRFWFVLRLISGCFAITAYPLGAALWGSFGIAVSRVIAGLLHYIPGAIYILYKI